MKSGTIFGIEIEARRAADTLVSVSNRMVAGLPVDREEIHNVIGKLRDIESTAKDVGDKIRNLVD